MTFLTAMVLAFFIIGMAYFVMYLHEKFDRKTKVSLYCTSIIFNNLKTEGIIMATQIPVKNFEQTTFQVRDTETGLFIDGVTYAEEIAVVADSSIASISIDPADGPDTAVLDVAGIAEGETDITFTVKATYIDPKEKAANPDSTKTTTVVLSAIVHVTVTPAPVGSTNTELVVTLGEPQAVPIV